jgi:hypothetical protein
METFFIIGAKRKETDWNNIVYIGEKWEYKTLLQYLVGEKGIDPYKTSENHLMIPYFSEEDCFISHIHNNPLELRLDEVLIPRESIAITGKKLDIEDISLNKYSYKEYDIFSGDKIPRDIGYKPYIENVISFFSGVLYQMLDCGYLELKNIDKMDDWIITFQEPVMDIFVRYHKIETSADDKSITEEFLENPKFRRTLCIMMMKIVSNFLVSNKMTKSIDFTGFKSWDDKNLWYHIRDKIKILS